MGGKLQNDLSYSKQIPSTNIVAQIAGIAPFHYIPLL